ncbi:MAG: type 3 dihydrofolate reductase [Thiothrix sp.]|nr:type 3 dihydrofolate reductase [Thiothrix sp.]HPE59320.1 type 3 dihydrofolate reductase [Thiolinea sp.]
MYALIVAMTPTRVIGLRGGMPWHLPADLAWFRQNTLGKPVVMGRRTWESLGRALPGRRNIVVSRSRGFQAPGAEVVSSPEAVEALSGAAPEVMIIGGAQLYDCFLPLAQRIYLTLVHAQLQGDTRFPDTLDDRLWQERRRLEREADAKNPYPCTFLVLERRQV